MTKKWLVTLTEDNGESTYQVEVEAKTYTQAMLEGACRLKTSEHGSFVVEIVEKVEN